MTGSTNLTDGTNPENPLIPPQDDGNDGNNPLRDLAANNQDNPIDNTGLQDIPVNNAATTPQQIDNLLNNPDIALLLRYLSDKYAKEDASATAAATTNPTNPQSTPSFRRRPLFQSITPTVTPAQVTPQYIIDELATNREREKEMAKTIKDMKSQMHRAISSAPEIDKVIEESQQNPFTARISGADMRNIGKLKLSTYDGTTDPREHMTAFTIATGRARLSEEERGAVLCQLFVENLSGAALKWFSKLKAGSINSFNDLSQAFMKQYSILILPEESTANLWSMVQKPEESLRDYINRFKAVASRVTIDDVAAIEALRRGLWYNCRFKETLSSSKPSTLDDALHRASIYINIEEERQTLRKQHVPKTPTPTKEKHKEVYREPRQHYDNHQDDKRQKTEATYQIHSEHKAQLPWNKYVRSDDDDNRPEGRTGNHSHSNFSNYDRSDDPHRNTASGSYCDYHNRSGHSTSECRQLQDFLLSKYKRGEVPDAVYKTWRSDNNDNRTTQNE